MALNFLLKRSGTASKRPVGASMALGEVDLNYDSATGGLFYKDSAGGVVKVGPAQVSSSAPNSTPAGSAGNSVGEFWYDTSNSVLKVWNGISWINTVSTSSFLPLSGGTMTGDITFNPSEVYANLGINFQDFSKIQAISDSTSTTSSTTAASSTAVKSAYDLANSALPKAGGTMTGNITFNGAQTFPVSGIQSASTSQAGVVQLNDSTTSTSTTEALTANQGKILQDEIDALAVTNNIILGGTYNANTGLVSSVTTQGTTAGLVVGNALPAPGPTNDEIFVIVDVQGTNGPNSPTVCHVGDWFLSNGTTWQFLNVGFAPGQATTTSQGVVQLATDAEVQAGTDSNNAVVSSSLQSKMSDSTSTTSSTAIASSTAVKSAYDAGIQGQTDAATAQGTADQAVLDAAAAQGTADQAILDAAAAQGTADAALPKAGGTMTGDIVFNSGQTFSGTVSNQDFQAKGDLVAGYGANSFGIQSVGTNGQVLSANSATASGLEWVNAGGASTWVTYNQLITFNPGDVNQPIISWPGSRGNGSGYLSNGNVSAMVYFTVGSGTNGATPEAWSQMLISSRAGTGMTNVLAADDTNGRFSAFGSNYPAFDDTTVIYTPNASITVTTTYLVNISLNIFGGFQFAPTVYGTTP